MAKGGERRLRKEIQYKMIEAKVSEGNSRQYEK